MLVVPIQAEWRQGKTKTRHHWRLKDGNGLTRGHFAVEKQRDFGPAFKRNNVYASQAGWGYTRPHAEGSIKILTE